MSASSSRRCPVGDFRGILLWRRGIRSRSYRWVGAWGSMRGTGWESRSPDGRARSSPGRRFTINVSGSFAIGLLTVLLSDGCRTRMCGCWWWSGSWGDTRRSPRSRPRRWRSGSGASGALPGLRVRERRGGARAVVLGTALGRGPDRLRGEDRTGGRRRRAVPRRRPRGRRRRHDPDRGAIAADLRGPTTAGRVVRSTRRSWPAPGRWTSRGPRSSPSR